MCALKDASAMPKCGRKQNGQLRGKSREKKGKITAHEGRIFHLDLAERLRTEQVFLEWNITGTSASAVNAVFLHFSPECVPPHVERLRGPCLVPIRGLQGAEDHFLFRALHGAARGITRAGGCAAGSMTGGRGQARRGLAALNPPCTSAPWRRVWISRETRRRISRGTWSG